MNSPLPPTSASAAVAIRSPLVRIGTISIVTDGTIAASLCRTNSACASASRLGREPIRSTEVIYILDASGGGCGSGFLVFVGVEVHLEVEVRDRARQRGSLGRQLATQQAARNLGGICRVG